MKTEQIFRHAGFTQRANAILKGGRLWLARSSRHVQGWADSLGLDVSESLAEDIGLCSVEPPEEPVKADIVIPFWEGDRHLLKRSVRSMMNQKYSDLTLHVVADGCEFPEDFDDASEWPLHQTVRMYKAPKDSGPYLIANAIAHLCQTDFLGIMDADDTSRPDRMWTQIQRLQKCGGDCISSAMVNYIGEGSNTPYMNSKIKWEPILYPGRVYEAVPRGSCVNAIRTMKLDAFRRVNGFPPIICTGDFAMDNALLFIEDPPMKVLFDMNIMGDRMLRSSSLSHGILPMGSDRRKEAVQQVLDMKNSLQRDPSEKNVRSFGGYDKPIKLERLN